MNVVYFRSNVAALLQLLRPPHGCQRCVGVFCICCHEPKRGRQVRMSKTHTDTDFVHLRHLTLFVFLFPQVQPGDAGFFRVLPLPVLRPHPVGWRCGLHSGKLSEHGPPHPPQPALHTQLFQAQSVETSAGPAALPPPAADSLYQRGRHRSFSGTTRAVNTASLCENRADVCVFLRFQSVFCCDRGWLLRLLHVGCGAVCLFCVLAVVVVTETRLVQFVESQLLPQYRKKRT